MKSSDPNASNPSDRHGKPIGFSRRQLLAGTPLAAFGVAVSGLTLGSVTSSAAAESTEKENSAGDPVDLSGRSETKEEELDDFMFDIEKDGKGWTGPGGSAKEASVAEFPLSRSIAGVSMRLNPGGFRELHWHAIAAEWAYVLEGRLRTTVISPDGQAETDEFQVGDIWYFPKGHGHGLECIGNQPCHFLLGFDSGHFSEFGTFSVTDWLGHTDPGILSRELNLPVAAFANIPRKEVYIGVGHLPPKDAPDNLNPAVPPSQSSHKFRLETMPPTHEFPGGFIKIVSSKEFPIQSTLTAARMDIEPGGFREMHWHPNADEWQFVMGGEGKVTIFGSHGRVKTMPYGPGMISFVKQGYGHFVENTGTETLRLLILFNAPTYEEIFLTSWLAANPAQLVADHFGLTLDQVNKFPKDPDGIIDARI
jgi:oxalate decarboxylase